MKEWALLIGFAIGDPEAVEIARYESLQSCRRAEMTFYALADKAAQERGADAVPDLYGACKEIPSR